MKTHNTLVMGWNEDKSLGFIKTFHYPSQEQEMRECIAFVTKNYYPFRVGDAFGMKELKTLGFEATFLNE